MHPDSRNTPRGFGSAELMLLMVAAVWGGSYAVAKQSLLQLPALQFLSLRFGLTFVVLLPALAPLWRGPARRGLAVGGILGANLLAVFVCETFGVALTSAGNAAFLISLCVAFTPFVEWGVQGRRPANRVFVAAAMSVAGAALLSATSPDGTALGRGDALMLAAALLRALMVCLTQRLAGRHALPALTLTALQSGVIAVGAGLLAVLTPTAAWVSLPVDAGFWWGMAFLVLACTLFAFFAQNHAASRTSPSRVSLLMGSEPVFGALVAVGWLGERIAPLGWLGGLMIVLAAWWTMWPQRPSRVAASPG